MHIILYLKIGISRHPLERADNVKRACARVYHLCLSTIPEAHNYIKYYNSAMKVSNLNC